MGQTACRRGNSAERAGLLLVLAACVVARPALAQHEHAESPYAGMEGSEIPSLTAKELGDLRSGAGMGLARPAELNGYPGPRHVLELAEALELTEEQRTGVESVYSEMRARAVELGETIVEAERHLGLRFQHRHVDDESLRNLTADIARMYGELRFVHLRAHLATRDLLTEDQVDAYDRLRGYRQGEP